jgi:hypothetical protein
MANIPLKNVMNYTGVNIVNIQNIACAGTQFIRQTIGGYLLIIKPRRGVIAMWLKCMICGEQYRLPERDITNGEAFLRLFGLGCPNYCWNRKYGNEAGDCQ